MIKLGISYGILEYSTLFSTFLDKCEATDFIFACYRLGSDRENAIVTECRINVAMLQQMLSNSYHINFQ